MYPSLTGLLAIVPRARDNDDTHSAVAVAMAARRFCSIAWAQCAWSAMNSARELCKARNVVSARTTFTVNGRFHKQQASSIPPKRGHCHTVTCHSRGAATSVRAVFNSFSLSSANCFAIAREKHGNADRVPLER
jgi:hypothetical protein